MLRNLKYSVRLLSIGWTLARHDALFGVDALTLSLPTRLAIKLITKRNRRLRRGQRVSLALQKLGPSFIKLGQALSTRADVGAMANFVSKYNLNFTNLNDANGSIWALFNVPWQPAYVFLRPDGSSTFVNNPTSAMSQQELTDRVQALTS
jgi:hypothetical protein